MPVGLHIQGAKTFKYKVCRAFEVKGGKSWKCNAGTLPLQVTSIPT